MIVVTTYLGLLAVTFFIGRVMPIDPVLAIVGDRRARPMSSSARAASSGLNQPLCQQFCHLCEKAAAPAISAPRC